MRQESSIAQGSATPGAATASLSLPAAKKPWEDPSLSAEVRLQSYKRSICERLDEFEQGLLALPNLREWKEFARQDERLRLIAEAKFLQDCSAERFVEWLERNSPPTLLGKNFLGAKAWHAIGVYVGEEPPLPAAITKELLEADCPLHPGKKIKDTHLLLLLPETVDGTPYSALALANLCANRTGSATPMIFSGADWTNRWRSRLWAKVPQGASEWVCIPKANPALGEVDAGRQFRSKNWTEQELVRKQHYPQYQTARVLALLTAALLNDLVNGEPRILSGWTNLRCQEPVPFSAHVCVGQFNADGIVIGEAQETDRHTDLGLALIRAV